MEESFEYRSLLDRDALRALQTRKDLPSVIRLALQLGAFLAGIALLVYLSPFAPAAFAAALALGAVWTTFFAPFHECAHQTAFRTRRLNSLAGWLTGIPFGMGPTVYREFHFEHHRFTHIPDKDPELAGNATFAQWPTTPSAWGWMVAGLWLIWLKVRLMLRLAASSTAHTELPPPFADPDLRATFIWESRAVACAWSALPLLALLDVRGTGWILFALIPCHVLQAIWLTAEHTGLPHEGTILDRTRTTCTSGFVSWWLWNMNYHAEHHAWPAVPWHALPALNAQVRNHLEHESWGYWNLQMAVLRQESLPDGAPAIPAAK